MRHLALVIYLWPFKWFCQVLLIGGSTGTMLEALQVVGDGHDGSLGDVSYLPLWCTFTSVRRLFISLAPKLQL